MNVQTERLENHTAQITVPIEAERLETEKRKAAKKLSRQYRIPGFRKGKAPYKIIAKYVGEAAILEKAIESMMQDVYKEALEASDVEPYGPGSLEDVAHEPDLSFVFSVPMAPEVALGDYRSIRLEYEEPELDDETLDDAMKQLQSRQALVEESHQPIAAGNRVMLDINAEFADGEERQPIDENADVDTTTSDDDDEDDAPFKGDRFMHQHDFQVDLLDDPEPILPGFVEALVGADVEDTVEFELTIPDDEKSFADIVGRQIHFSVVVKKIEVLTLPALNDDFAARLTEDEDEPLTLLQLRMRVRENMLQEMKDKARSAYANEMVQAIVDQADIVFPELMVEDRLDEYVKELDDNLRQQNMDVQSYLAITGQTEEDIRNAYYPQAVDSVERSLTVTELIHSEGFTLDDAAIDARIDDMLAGLGEQAQAIRPMFDTPQQREAIANNLLLEALTQRLFKIGRGEPIEDDTPEDDDTQAAAEDAETEAPTTVATTEGQPEAVTPNVEPETDDTTEDKA